MTIEGSARAASAVQKALKCGQLPRITAQTKCVDCSRPAQVYDHRDYGKPLEVEPVCQRCNVHRGPGLPYKGRRKRWRKNQVNYGSYVMERENFYLPEPTIRRLKALSKQLGISVAEVIRRAIDEYLALFRRKP